MLNLLNLNRLGGMLNPFGKCLFFFWYFLFVSLSPPITPDKAKADKAKQRQNKKNPFLEKKSKLVCYQANP
jgi:hypothetical protein